MAVLLINPAVREELFTIDNKGKHTLDEGAFAESLVDMNRLVCYNGLLYDHTGAAIGGAEFESRFRHDRRYEREGKDY